MKLSTTTKSLDQVAKKYCRLIVTEDAPNVHRLVETKDGTLEYRLGAGKWKQMTPRKFRLFLRSIVQAAKSHQIEYLAIQIQWPLFPKLEKTYGLEWVYATVAENLLLAAYEFTAYKSKKTDKKQLKEILICGGLNKEAEAGFKRGQVVGHYTNLTRDIANTPGEDMTPNKLAAAAKKAVTGTKAKVTVLDHKKIKSLKMGLLDAVGKGASDKPRLIRIDYSGGMKSEQPIVLIGKGITYDTGGINLKPTGALHEMHMDMSGGAAVIGAIAAIAKLGLKKNVIALIPAAENSISDKAMRTGDILTSMSGKTVEVLNTDAEGRLVLADALTYTEKHLNPKAIVDCATLTGAALVALGQRANAVMTPNKKLQSDLERLGEESGDLTWPLPLWDEYKEGLTSSRADHTNMSGPADRLGGSVVAGAFLALFAPKNIPWAHIDIAPRMVSIPSDKLAKGAAGEPVRLLVKFVESH